MNCWPGAAADEVTVGLNSSMRSEPCVSYTCTELTSSGATTNLQIGLELAHRLRKAIENRESCCLSQDIRRGREPASLQSQLAASSLLKLGHCDFSATPHYYKSYIIISRTSKSGRAQSNEIRDKFSAEETNGYFRLYT
jgi:hypothetical protein